MSFSHLDAGTPERLWADAFATRSVREATQDFERLVVVSAHPDDETLGVAGLLRLGARREASIVVLVLTDGENSHPASPTTTPSRLRGQRRREVREAVSLLAPAADVRFLALPDGQLREHSAEVSDAIGGALGADERRTLLVSPWTGDGHGDHRVAGEISEAEAARHGAVYRAYPIWLWHWGSPDDAPWERMERIDLDDDALAAKTAGLAAHPSQTTPLSDRAGDEPILHVGMQEHFARDFEVLIAPASSTPEAHFDRFYASGEDPWGFDSRWYEARKRAVLLAALPRAQYAAVVELGCSSGALTARLAERSDRVLALDFAEAALDAARARLAGQAHVTLVRATLPRDWPAGDFDLVVFSELGYYLGMDDLEDLISRIASSVVPGGHVVACHWRHPVPDGPLDGDTVHAALRRAAGWTALVRHEEEDFVLEVFGVPPARSVAAETGLIG